MTNSTPQPENPSPRKPRFSGRAAAAVWLSAGLGLGIVGTFALARPKPEVRTIVVGPLKAPKSFAQDPKPTATSPVKPVSTSMLAAPPAIEHRQLPDLAIDTPPASPFGPSMDLLAQLPKAPSPLKGSLPKVPMIPREFVATKTSPPAEQPGDHYLNDILDKGVPKPPAALRPVEQGAPTAGPTDAPKAGSMLLTIREVATAPESQAQDLASFAKSLKGTAEVLVDRTHGVSEKDRKTTVVGVLVTLPPGAVEAFQSHLKDGGGLVDVATWTGSPDTRRDRLTDDARTRLASLGSLHEALLATKADAGALKDVDEDIAHAKKILDQLQAAPLTDTDTIVRIVFVSK